MQNVQEIKNTLKGLDGVNQDFFESNFDKHQASIIGEEPREVYEIMNECESHGIGYVKDDGIVDYILLAHTKEELAKKFPDRYQEEQISGRKVA